MKKLFGLLIICIAFCIPLAGCAFLIEAISQEDYRTILATLVAFPFFSFWIGCYGLAIFDNKPTSQVWDEKITAIQEWLSSFFENVFGCLGSLLVIALAVGLCSWLGPTGVIIVLLVLILLK